MNFSVIVPTYNRKHSLMRLLQSIEKSESFNGKVEIIIVDNNSTDNTRESVVAFSKQSRFRISVFSETRQGPSYARNLGIAKARFKHVIFLDDDVTVTKKIFLYYQHTWSTYPTATLCGGKIVPKYLHMSKILEILDAKFHWVFASLNHGNIQRKLIYPEALFSANCSLNLASVAVPVFDTDLGSSDFCGVWLRGEDYELSMRLHLQGKTLVYTPFAKVWNLVPSNRESFFYIVKRNLYAGIERFVIDKKLQHLGLVVFQYSLKGVAKDLVSAIKGPSRKKKLIGTILDLLYFFGYVYAYGIVQLLSRRINHGVYTSTE